MHAQLYALHVLKVLCEYVHTKENSFSWPVHVLLVVMRYIFLNSHMHGIFSGFIVVCVWAKVHEGQN